MIKFHILSDKLLLEFYINVKSLLSYIPQHKDLAFCNLYVHPIRLSLKSLFKLLYIFLTYSYIVVLCVCVCPTHAYKINPGSLEKAIWSARDESVKEKHNAGNLEIKENDLSQHPCQVPMCAL